MSPLQDKKILIIGGGKWQVPIIQKAKELGCIVINTNLYENSDGFIYADYSYVVDVLDKEKNLQIARQHKVDGVITDQSDIAVNTVAYINKKLGLYGNTTAIAQLYTNKLLMRENLKVEGIQHPKYKICKTINDIEDFFYTIQSPIIVKPLNNQSSRGFSIIRTKADIQKAFNNVVQNSSLKQFLAEEFIDGIEITVEGFKSSGNAHSSLCVSQKEYYENQIGVAKKLTYAPEFQEFDVEKLLKLNNYLFNAVDFAITHTEYKYFNNQFYLIESAIRGGGTKISSDIVPMLSGIDTNKTLIENALGIRSKHEQISPLYKYAQLEFFAFASGLVSKINGLDIIQEEKNILELVLEFDVGDIITQPMDDRSRNGYFIIFANSSDELKALSEKIKSSVTVELK